MQRIIHVKPSPTNQRVFLRIEKMADYLGIPFSRAAQLIIQHAPPCYLEDYGDIGLSDLAPLPQLPPDVKNEWTRRTRVIKAAQKKAPKVVKNAKK